MCGDLQPKKLKTAKYWHGLKKETKICTTPTLKLVKTMLKCQVAKAFRVYAPIQSNNVNFNVFERFFCIVYATGSHLETAS